MEGAVKTSLFDYNKIFEYYIHKINVLNHLDICTLLTLKSDLRAQA